MRAGCCWLLLAVGCGIHDTPVATYNVPLPEAPSGGTAGSAVASAGGGAGGEAGSLTSGSGGLGGEAAASSAPQCPESYTTLSEGLTSRYRVVMPGVPWLAAQLDCEADGAHLAVVDDELENAWLSSVAEAAVTDSPSSNQLLWLGMGDHNVEGDFHWVTGARLGLTLWAADEPNSKRGIEDCVEMRASGEWNDDRCNAKLAYVCECDGALQVKDWCDTDAPATCGDCSTSCTAEQTCIEQLCQ